MKRVLLFFIFLLTGIGLFIWVIRLLGREEIESAFRLFTGWQGITVLFLTAFALFLGIWRWKVILKNLGYNMSSLQLTGPYLAGFSLIYLFPMVVLGGEIFRGYSLRGKFNVPWEKGVSSMMIDKILEITVILATISAGFIFFLFKISLLPRNLGIIFGGVLLFSIIGTAFFYFKSFKKESIAKHLLKFLGLKRFINNGLDNGLMAVEKETFAFLKPKNKAMWQGLGLAFLRIAVMWLRTWLLILFLGKNIGVLPALSVLSFYYLALLIPIPTALGTHEVVQFFSFEALGLGTNVALAFTMIQRGAELFLAFLGLIILCKLGMGLLRTFLFKKIENLTNDRK